MSLIAILHFTGPPAIGGIEGLMSVQASVLQEQGIDVRILVGRGGAIEGAETRVISTLHPAESAVLAEGRRLEGRYPSVEHPLVLAIARDIEKHLEGCDACWVHNALTVYLNPFLTIALRQLAKRLTSITWVAWCADLTDVSAFQARLGGGDGSRLRGAVPGVRYIALSQSRREELCELTGLDASNIPVIHPPLDVSNFLGLGTETRRLYGHFGIEDADVVMLLPSKLLPHKGLDRALGLAACLRDLVPRPLVLITGASSPHEPELSSKLKATLREQIQSSGLADVVHLLPDTLSTHVSTRTVRELMMLSDLVFLPSLEEGFGVPLREAALVRVPVLCTDIPAFREAASGDARFFKVEEAGEQLAATVLNIVRTPVNAGRRVALSSVSAYRRQLLELL